MAVDPQTGLYHPDDYTNVRQWLDFLGSNTLGIVWRSGTGTVDPWTKSGLVSDEATAKVQAQGTPVNDTTVTDAVYAQAEADVTARLKENNADPSQASFLGNNPGLENALYYLKMAGYLAIVVAGFYVIKTVAELVKE